MKVVGDLAIYFLVSLKLVARSASDILTAGQFRDSIRLKLEASSFGAKLEVPLSD